MASQPTFDLYVPGRADSSVMDWFAARGFDTWTMDNEGYGRSDKNRPHNNDISNGADDLAAGTEYVLKKTGAKKMHMYGISSGALKAALFAQRHPERVGRLALDAFVWTGEGSPTLAERKKKLPQFQAMNRRPIDRAFVHSIFKRDHPGTADEATDRGLRRRDPRRSTTRCPPAPTWTCARSCRWSIPRRSRRRRS